MIIPLDKGDVLREIKLITSEPGLSVETDRYQVWIDWIKLEAEDIESEIGLNGLSCANSFLLVDSQAVVQIS